MTGNTVYGNDAAGIYVDGAAYVKIDGNLVYRNRAGIECHPRMPIMTPTDIWVFNNLVYDNRDAGLLLVWDDRRRTGYAGVQRVLIAFNTLVDNKYSIYLAGEKNSAEIMNNLGYATDGSIHNSSQRSFVVAEGNVWLPRSPASFHRGPETFV